jgi:hypothetical protein
VDLVCEPGARSGWTCRLRLDDAEEGIDDVTEMQPSHSSDARGDGVTLRLLWPQ